MTRSHYAAGHPSYSVTDSASSVDICHQWSLTYDLSSNELGQNQVALHNFYEFIDSCCSLFVVQIFYLVNQVHLFDTNLNFQVEKSKKARFCGLLKFPMSLGVFVPTWNEERKPTLKLLGLGPS